MVGWNWDEEGKAREGIEDDLGVDKEEQSKFMFMVCEETGD